MAKVNTFRDLVAWQKAMTLAKLVYQATARMPRKEQFRLTWVLRAAVSIPSNITEGFSRQSRPELIQFLRVATGSLNELSTQIELACSLGMPELTRELSELISELDRALQGLIRSLERKRP